MVDPRREERRDDSAEIRHLAKDLLQRHHCFFEALLQLRAAKGPRCVRVRDRAVCILRLHVAERLRERDEARCLREANSQLSLQPADDVHRLRADRRDEELFDLVHFLSLRLGAARCGNLAVRCTNM